MYKNLRWKIITIVAVAALAVWAFTPPSERLTLGLDLKGGIHLLLKVETHEALMSETDTARDQLREALKTAGIAVTAARTISPTQFDIEGVPPTSEPQFRTISDQQVAGAFDREALGEGKHRFVMRINIAANRRTEAVRQALLTIETRVNEFGVSEPTGSRYGSSADRIVVQLPGINDVNRAKSIIRRTARLEIKLVEAGPAPDEKTLLAARNGVLPDDSEVVYGASPVAGATTRDAYLVKRTATIAGTDLRTARETVDEYNQPAVSFTLNRDGVAKFSKATGENVGRLLAIILDDVVVSAPSIRERISTADARITGVSRAEAADLALVLRSGALPASLTLLEQREVGPTLGADSIRAGVTAAIGGLVFVTLFMFAYYRLTGFNALVSIALNLVILLGFMAYIGAVMTLPGIAGFILTIGMGVDSNVLIFERIREELGTNKGARQAVAAGFDRVFLTILDTHIASLIAAAFLFQFGTGPIRGFATTLVFGLVANVFTAVFVSRTLFELILSQKPAGSPARLSI
jgi:preprotein translocase subunit SecD